MRSDACIVISTQLLSCPVPQWSFPAIEAVVTVFSGDQQILRNPDSPTFLYDFLPTCQTYSSLWAYVVESNSIDISGYGLAPVPDATCVFRAQDTNITVPAQSLNAGGSVTYRCSTPMWNLSACAAAQTCMRNASLLVTEGNSREICSEKPFAFLSAWNAVEGSGGLAAGGSLVTVRGAGFDPSSSDYVCRFKCPDSDYLSASVMPLSKTMLVCTVPAIAALPCTADIDLLQGSHRVHRLQEPAGYEYAPVWLSTNRKTVPMTGEASMAVYGVFQQDAEYICLFRSLEADGLASPVDTPALLVSGSLISCAIPAWDIAGDARFGVGSADGVELAREPSEDYIITFTQESWSSFEPLSSLVVGPIRLFFFGSFEDGAADYSCKIASSGVSRVASVSSQSVTSSSVECELPQWHPDAAGSARIYLMRDGVEIVPSREPLSFRLDAVWTGLSASSGTSSGGTVITVYGNGFSNVPNFYTCRFCKNECMQMQSSVATFISPSQLNCTLPSWTFAGGVATVELDSKQGILQYCGLRQVPGPVQYGCSVGSSSTGAPFGDTFEFLPSWQDFYPQVVPSTEGISVTVSGYGFDVSRSCTCSFTAESSSNISATVDATIVSSKLLICDKHEWMSSSALSAKLNVECNGVLFLAEGSATLLHTMNSVEFVKPSKLSAGGGTRVTLQGINFCYSGESASCSSNNYRCIFASEEYKWNSSIVPRNVTSHSVVCESPSWPFEIPVNLSVHLLDLQMNALVWAKKGSALSLYEAVTDAYVVPCSGGTCSAGTCSNASTLCLSASTMHTIAVAGNGFNVSAIDYVCSIQLTDSRGRESWLEGAATKPTSTQHLLCDVPMLPLGYEARDRIFYVRRNGQILGSVQAEHYPEWTSLSPSVGSAHGCTSLEFPCALNARHTLLRAYGLIRSRKYFCRYVDAQGREISGLSSLPVSETEAICFLPVWTHKAAVVTVYLVEEAGRVIEHLPQSPSAGSNTFLIQPIVTDFSPKAFMSNETTAIFVTGFGFAAGSVDTYECRVISSFDQTVIMTTVASPATDKQMLCRVPAVPLMSQRAVLRVVDLGPPESEVAFAEHLDDEFLAIEKFWARLVPSEAPASGGDLVTVVGSGFESASDSYLCKFSHTDLGSVESPGIATSSTAVVCEVPRWSFQETSMFFELVEATNTIQARGNSEFIFRATWWLQPLQGSPVDGGAEITISGYGFDTSRYYRVLLHCSSGTVMSDDLVALDFNTIVFVAPAIDSIQDHEQNVSNVELQRKNATESEPISVYRLSFAPVQYFSYVDRVWTSWRGVLVNGDPFDYSDGEIRSPTSGGTTIYLSGDGFDDGGKIFYMCRFSGAEGSADSIAAVPVNRTLIKCLVPPWPFEVKPGEPIMLTILRNTSLPFEVELRQDAKIEFVPVVSSLLEPSAPNTNNSIIVQGRGFDRFILYSCVFEQRSSVAPYFPVESRVVGARTLSETEIQCDSVDWGSEFRSRNITVVVKDEAGALLHAAFNIFAMPLQVLMIPWFVRSVPAESYVFAEPRVTIFAHGLDGTLPSIARDLAHGDHRPLQHLDPDLNLNQSTGVVFNLQTRHGVLIDGIDLHTKKLSENTKCAVFYRNGSFEGFENDLSAWYQVPCAVADNDLASLTRLELGESLALPAKFMVALLVLLTDGIEYVEPQSIKSEDRFLGIQGGGVVLADWNHNRGYEIQSVLFTSVQNTPFAGKVVYRNQEILGRKYKCKFEHDVSQHMVETNFSYAFTADDPDKFVAQSFTCQMPRWPYGEALVRLSIEDDTGQVLRNIGGSAGNFRIYSRWETLSQTVARAFGGSLLRLTGHGFDVSSLSTYACKFENAAVESETSSVVVHNLTHMECVSPRWNFAASKTTITVQRNGRSVHTVAASQLFEFTEGMSVIQPTTGPAQGGVATTIEAFGLDANVPYQCAWSMDNETSFDVHNSSVVSMITPAVNVSVWYAFCISPAWGLEHEASNVSVHLLRDGIPLDRRGNNVYLFESTWQQIHPSQGSFATTYAITFTGHGFDENIGDWHGKPGSSHPPSQYTAIFAQWGDSTAFVASTCVYTTRTRFVVCNPPEWPYEAMAIRVSLEYRNATVLYTGDSGNMFVPSTSWRSVNASEGPASGGTSLLIKAQSLRTDQEYSCLFKSKTTLESISCAQRVSATALTCRTPLWDHAAQQTYLVILDSDGLQISFEAASNASQTFRFLAGLTGASVSKAYSFGGDAIIFEGFGFGIFSAEGTYKCVWSHQAANQVMQVNATVLTSQRLSCVQPSWGSSFAARNTTLQILHNGENMEFESGTPRTTNFEWVASWTHLDSRTQLMSSSDSIRIFGFGFDSTRESEYVCNFTSMDDSSKQSKSERVKVVSSVELICHTGEWKYEIADTSVSLYLDNVLISYTGNGIANVTFIHSVTSMQPTSAPTTGHSVLTVSGFAFNSRLNYTCSFVARISELKLTVKAQVVNINTITCIVPDWTIPAQGTNFLLGSSRGAVKSAAAYGMLFSFASTWTTHVPRRSSADGGGNMTVSGAGFDNTQTVVDEYRCIFTASQTSESVFATVLSMNTILCRIPIWGTQYAAGIVNISLTADGSQVHSDADASFEFWQAWVNTHPKEVPAGSAKITITGTGFIHKDRLKYRCTFNNTMDASISLSSPVVVVNASMLVCENANWQHANAVAKVGLIYEGAPVVFEGADLQTVSFYATWDSVEPSSAPSTGGSQITISGHGFRSDENYSCIFKADISGYNKTSLAEYVSVEELRCVTPFWESLEQNVLLVIISKRLENESSSSDIVASTVVYGGHTTGGSDTATFAFESRLFAVKPSTGSAKGGTSLVIPGNGLDDVNNYQCLWTTDRAAFDPSGWFHQWNEVAGRAMMNASNGSVFSFGVTATVLNNSMLACKTPAWGNMFPSLIVDFLVIYEVDTYPVEVESEGLQFYYTMEIFEVSPKENSPLGIGSITIHGTGFDRHVDLKCIFTPVSDTSQSVESPNLAIVHGLDKLECKLPIWPFGRGPSTVRLQQTSSSQESNLGFMEFLGRWQSIYPSTGTAVGGVSVTIRGFGFDGTGHEKYRCAFSDGNMTVYSTPFLAAVDPQNIICFTPPWPAQAGIVNVTVQSYPNVSFFSVEPWNQEMMTFDYREQVVRFTPLYADFEGGDLITVTGLAFQDVAYRCVFSTKESEGISLPSIAKDQSTVICEAPYWGEENSDIQVLLFRDSQSPPGVPESVHDRLQNVSKFAHLSARELSGMKDRALISQWGDASICCDNSTGPVYVKDRDYSPGAAVGYVAFESDGEFLQIDEPQPVMLQSWGGLTIIAVARFRCANVSGCFGQPIFEVSSDVNCSYETSTDCLRGGNIIFLSRHENTSKLTFQIKQTDCASLPGSCTEEVVCQATTDHDVIQDNKWMSIVARYTSKENVAEIFVDGVLLVKEACDGSWTDKNLTRSYIGKSSRASDDYFAGDIRGMLIAKEAVDNETFLAVLEDLTKGGFDVDNAIRPRNGTETRFGFVLINRAPDFFGSTIYGIEGVLFDDVWGTFTRGMWRGVNRVDEFTQNVTFIVESVRPSSLFAIQPSIRPCGHEVLGCNTSFIKFRSKEGMYGNAVIRVYIQDSGGSLFSGIDTSEVKTFFIRISPPDVTPSFRLGGTIRVLENAGMIRVSSFVNDVIFEWDDFKHFSLEAVAQEPHMFAVQPFCSISCITERECVGHLNFETAKNLHGNTTIRIRMAETTYDQDGSHISALTNWSSLLIIIKSVNQPPEFTINGTVRNFPLNGKLTTLKEDDGPCFSLDYFATNISPGPNTDVNGTACLMSNGMQEIYRENALGCNEHNQTLTFQVLPTYRGTHNVTVSSPVLLHNGTLQFCIRENSCGHGDVECYSSFSVSLKDDGGIANGGNDTSFSSFVIYVQEVNHPPAFDMHPSITVMEVESLTFHTFTAQVENISKGGSDEEYQSVYFNSEFIAGAENLIEDGLQISSNGSITFSTRPYHFGYVIFKVWLEDDGGVRFGRSNRSADRNLTIHVQYVNHRPSFVINSPVYLNESSNGTIRGVATNITAGLYEDTQNLTFQVSISDEHEDLFLEIPSITDTGDLIYRLNSHLNGQAVFSVALDDDGGGPQNRSETNNFTIIVQPVNDRPVFSIQSTVSSFEEDAFVLPAFATDISAGPGTENAEQAVSFFVSCMGLAFSQDPHIAPNGTLRFEPVSNVNGLSNCTVRLQDSGGTHRGGLDTSVDHQFIINVTAVNDAPSFSLSTTNISFAAYVPNLPTNDTSNYRTETIISSFSAGPSDEEDTQQVYFTVDWSAHSDLFQNVNITIMQEQARIEMFLTPYQFTTEPVVLYIRAHDDGGTSHVGNDVSSVQELRVSILFVNSPPSFNLAETIVQVDEDSSYSPSGPFVTNISSDPSAQPQTITFSVIGTSDILVSGPTIDSNGNLNFDLTPNAFGKALFAVSAQDSGGTDRGGVDTSLVRNFTIEVASVNDPPTFEIQSLAGPFFMNPDANISVPDFVSSISKGDDREEEQTITFSVSFTSGESLVSSIGVSPDGTLSLALAPNAYGIGVYEVVAVDSGNGNNTSAAKTFDLEVLFKNQAPSFSLNATTLVVDEDSNCDCNCGHVGLCCTAGVCSLQQFAHSISKGPDLPLEAVQNLSFIIIPGAGAGGLIKPGAAVNGNGTLVFELEEDQIGSADFSMYLQDSGGTDGGGVNQSEARSFKVQVNSVNDAPSFSVSASQFFVLEDQGQVQLAGAMINISSGPENEDQTVSFTVVCVGLGFKLQPSISFDGALTFESKVRVYMLISL